MDHLTEAGVRIEGTAGRRTDDALVLPEFDAVEGYVEAAIRDGLAAESVRSYLERMGIDVAAFEPLSAELGGQGELTEAEARELRLDCADRLRRATGRTVRAD